MSHICMMCSRTPLMIVRRMEGNFLIRILSKAFFKSDELFFNFFKKILEFLILLDKTLNTNSDLCLNENNPSKLDLSYLSCSATSASVLRYVTAGGSSFLIT